ncbi:glutamyl-tRNA amidotransferase [Williamsia sp. 1138]|uniref:GatB/YqeY domain-containing protein n=1 Tax=Williamsia sp. 1138 TaxID=1903117 RepID=UPI000A11FC87|nr:GatB/YqeY domain-containing protein [Williamsia sp. 1138]OZG26182.1 glutamyl-tRNA amidotransferase [Williamsia sp. 1138]
MPTIKEQIRADLTTSMKARDTAVTGTLRMILAAIQAEEVSGKEAKELTDDDVLKVLARESKKRAEAATVFAENDREELAVKERAEGEIISRYLPSQLSDDELVALVDKAYKAVAEHTGEAPTMKQMGQIMNQATALAAGGADGKRLSSAVRAKLQS